MKSEITVQVFDSIDQIDATLIRKGFVKTEVFTLYDKYYSALSSEELRASSYKTIMDSSILLRNISDNTTELIYKNKKVDDKGVVLEEEKIITQVDSYDKTDEIFRHANLNNWCSLINRSTIYKQENIEFALQEIEGLGVFIEIEENEEMAAFSADVKLALLKDIILETGLTLGEDFSCKKPKMIFDKG